VDGLTFVGLILAWSIFSELSFESLGFENFLENGSFWGKM